MKIAIINTLPVPSGNASVNRFLGYGKGLVSLGMEVDVLSSSDCFDTCLDGVSIHSCRKRGSMLGTLYDIMRHIRVGEYDAVILVSNSLLLIYPIWLECRRRHIKLIQEKSEYPFVLMKKGFLNRLFALFYVTTTYRLFDGMIIMTKPLMDFFKNKVRKECLLFEMPMTVDVERFSINKKETEFGDYIAYCGDMAGNKDGVINLIDAFTQISKEIPSVKLLLIGGSSSQTEWKEIVSKVSKAGNKNIVLYGPANRDEIPELLKNAKVLALARPSNVQSFGGFPTKLGEYLATGNPVIVTAVGDIPIYLNRSNAYVVEPDNNKLFAETLVSILKDYEKARLVGEKGQDLARTVFSSKKQSVRLYNYLKTICE